MKKESKELIHNFTALAVCIMALSQLLFGNWLVSITIIGSWMIVIATVIHFEGERFCNKKDQIEKNYWANRKKEEAIANGLIRKRNIKNINLMKKEHSKHPDIINLTK